MNIFLFSYRFGPTFYFSSSSPLPSFLPLVGSLFYSQFPLFYWTFTCHHAVPLVLPPATMILPCTDIPGSYAACVLLHHMLCTLLFAAHACKHTFAEAAHFLGRKKLHTHTHFCERLLQLGQDGSVVWWMVGGDGSSPACLPAHTAFLFYYPKSQYCPTFAFHLLMFSPFLRSLCLLFPA